jgi:hypothetical protein
MCQVMFTLLGICLPWSLQSEISSAAVDFTMRPRRLPGPATESLLPPIGRRALEAFRTSLRDYGMDALHGLQRASQGLAMKGKRSN